VFETRVSSRRHAPEEADVTQILTPIFHALAERPGDDGVVESGASFDQDPLAAPLPAEQRRFDQPTERRGPLQVVAGRTTGGAHRARGAASPTRSYSSRAGFHSRPAQSATESTSGSGLTSGVEGTGAHRAPERSAAAGRTATLGHTAVAGRAGAPGHSEAPGRTAASEFTRATERARVPEPTRDPLAPEYIPESRISQSGAHGSAYDPGFYRNPSGTGSSDSGSHHAMSRTGGRHRTLRAVSR
jgi:hypothetical protein